MIDDVYHGDEGAVVKLSSCGELSPEGFIAPDLVIECDEDTLMRDVFCKQNTVTYSIHLDIIC